MGYISFIGQNFWNILNGYCVDTSHKWQEMIMCLNLNHMVIPSLKPNTPTSTVTDGESRWLYLGLCDPDEDGEHYESQ